MLDMFSFRGKSKNFLHLQMLLNEQGEKEADKFFDNLPKKEQVRLLSEVNSYMLDQVGQTMLLDMRKWLEEKEPFLGFSVN